jgi:hypothetical protein
MAVVISLASRLRTQPSQARTESPESAAILFFTGVRYEREVEPVAAEVPVRSRPRPLGAQAAARPKRTKKATRARQPA